MKRLLLIIFLGALLLNYGEVFSENTISVPVSDKGKYSTSNHTLYTTSVQFLSLELSDFKIVFGKSWQSTNTIKNSNFSASHAICFIQQEFLIMRQNWVTDLSPPVFS